jgi:CPA2 family monovalent cation:H+ antiporter-2
MHGEGLLQDLALIMIVAGAVTLVFHRLRQPVVLGYLIAGAIIGPNTPHVLLVKDEHTIEILAELGVIFLMFSLGLHFSLRKLARVGATALIAATLEIVVMVILGYAIGRAFGWKPMDSLFFGAILSISSTTIIIKALHDLKLAKERFAELVFGILIVEDILAIAMLALLSGIATTGSLHLGEIFLTLGKLAIFLALVLVIGLLTVPSILRYVSRFKSDEVLLITTLGMCFGVSLLAVKLGYSVALGAFLIGAIVAEARELGRIERVIEPVRDMFSAVFFVAIGMLIDPKLLIQYAWPIAVATVVVVIGKVMSCSAGTFLGGNSARTSLRVGMGLAQIGEFSFIIAQLGQSRGVTSEFLYPIAVMVSAVTTLLTPYLIKSTDPLVAWFDRKAPAPIAAFLQSYTHWVEGIGQNRPGNQQIRRLVRKWLLQLGLNMMLVTGIFLVGAWFGRYAAHEWPQWRGAAKGLVWLAAALLALPLIVATFRKIRAVAMVLAEMSLTRATAGQQTEPLRKLMANTIVFLASVAIIVWILLLSSAILPPWRVLIALALLIALAMIVGWKSMVRFYAKAQISLRETLTQEHPEHQYETGQPLPAMLKGAILETVKLADKSPANGRLVRELELRTKTGASIVGIDRRGEAITNPSPDEELHAGDDVLLIGSETQLQQARKLLSALPTTIAMFLATLAVGCQSTHPVHIAPVVRMFTVDDQQPTRSAGESITVGSYNVHWLGNSSALGDDLKRLDRVDVWCFQEVRVAPSIADGSCPDGLKAILPPGRWYGAIAAVNPLSEINSADQESQVIISRLPIKSTSIWTLDTTGEKQRVALTASLDLGGNELMLINTDHAPTFLSVGDENTHQVAALVDRLSHEPTSSVLVAGDFNCAGNLWRLRGNHRNANQVTKQMRSASFQSVCLDDPTFAPARLTIDRMYARNLPCLNCGIDNSATGSDHFPIWSTLRLPAKSQ